MKAIRKPLVTAIAGASAALLLQAAVSQAQTETYTVEHTFSIDDLQVDFEGTTFGEAGTASDPTAICGLDTPDSPVCPGDPLVDPAPFLDKQNVMLYPVDTTFGFNVVDFVGAEEKAQDGIFGEGWVGNIKDGDEVVGIKVANAETDTYKVKPPLWTW